MQSQLTIAEKELLLKLAKSLRVERNTVALPPITAVERREDLPLSFAQQRLWFLAQQMEGVSRAYHIFYGWRVKGQLDRTALRQALDRIVARHEVLRTTFVALDGDPRQRIAAATNSYFHLLEHDLSEQADSQEALDRLVKQEVGGGFDLAKGPLIRGRLIRLDHDEHALLISIHHIVSDGWSLGVFMKELSTLYGAFVRGERGPLPELEVQYADYAVWQREWMEGEVLRQQAEYWQRRLSGAPALLELPTDHARPAEQDYTGGWVRVELEQELTRALKELSKQHGMTLYMTMLAGWAALLARLSGQAEVVIGTPVANRGQIETEGLIGFFVNMLALRIDVSGSGSVVELLQQVKEQVLAAQQHQDIPFEQVVEVVQPVRSLSYTPLFQAGFSWQTASSEGTVTFPRLELRALPSTIHKVAKLDLSLSLYHGNDRIAGRIEYATALFEESTVERYLEYLRALLQSMVTDNTRAVESLPLLTASERRQVLYEWNATEAEYPRDKCLHELIEAQVEKSPEATAVVFEEEMLSYGELNRRANQLAHHLRELGVGPDQRVALCTERGVAMIVGLLGVLKAGGTYVPLDPAYPQERLQYMVQHSAPTVLLTQSQLLARLEQFRDSVALVELSDVAPQWSRQPVTNPERGSLSPQHLAYMIYTSGSTGLAKAVMVTHESVVNLFYGLNDGVYGRTADNCRRVSLNGPLAFDTSVKQVVQLLGGHVLEIIPEGVRRDGEALLQYLRSRQVEVLDCTPSQLGLLLEAGLVSEDSGSYLERLLLAAAGGQAEGSGSPGLVLVGGEAIEKRMWEQLGESALGFFNMYGPTECTGDASVGAVQAGTEPSIGRPLANTVVYVLDKELEAVPVGVGGELYIGGAGVARGYWGEAGATAEKFVADPYSGAAGARMYRTGDLGRRAADGTIQFLGRNDFQVKLRGYRIEPNEIASVLEQHPAVRKAVVTLHPNHEALQFVAYVVLDPMHSPSVAGGQRYKLPNNLAVVHLNRNETDFLYQEMFEIRAYFKHGITLRDGDCVFDVGANIGLFSLSAHLRARDLQIYAFEPSPMVFDLLKTNMQLYSVDARLSRAGLSREKKSVPLTFYPKFSFLSGIYADTEEDKEVVRSFVRKHKGNGNGVAESALIEELLEERFESREIEINLVTFSDMLRENNVKHVDLLKINVEKSEMDVLAGIEDEDWPKIRQIALEVHDIDGRLDAIVELLSRHDYKVAVEQDWQLEESTKTNFYVYARRVIENRDMRQATPTFVADQLVTPRELRAFVAQRLPEYMVPAAYVPLDALPLTPNGKVDRKRLPAPEGDAVVGDEPPVGELETTLAEVWGKVLRLGHVGRRDNFFERGGHSLLAVRVVNLLEQANINILVVDLFTYPTIESLAKKIAGAGDHSAADMPTCLKEGDAEKPLFLVHPSIFGYYGRVLAPHIDDGIPVYSVPPRALREAPDRTLEGMAMRMVHMIRTVQPEGPYRISGYSNGGPLAYEIAAQLLGADQKVDFLGVIDAYYRGGSQNTSAFQIEIDTKQALLGILEDACARPDKYVRRVTREALDELTQSARTMDLAAFLRHCQDRLVLPIRYDNLTATQLQQSLAHDRANELADLRYFAQPLPIPVHFFLAQERQESSVESWKSVVPPELLRVIPIQGNHQTIMDSPNVEGFGRALSDALRQATEQSGEMQERSFSPVIGLQSGRPNVTPHFCIPGAGASVTVFTPLVTFMDRTTPVYGLEPRGLDGDLVPHSSVRAAAETNVAAINEIYPRGPVHLLGHSFGGWVAFQMAHLLHDSGRAVASLTILDKEAPDQDDNVFREYTHTDILMDWINGFELILGHPLGVAKTDIESLTEAAQRHLLHRRLVAANLMPRRSEPDVLRGPLRTFAASIRAHYNPDKPYTGPLTLILVDDPRLDQAANQQYRHEVTENWKRFAPNLVSVHGPGNHLTMLREPHIRAVVDLTRNTF